VATHFAGAINPVAGLAHVLKHKLIRNLFDLAASPEHRRVRYNGQMLPHSDPAALQDKPHSVLVYQSRVCPAQSESEKPSAWLQSLHEAAQAAKPRSRAR
jgi:hypothetical protein